MRKIFYLSFCTAGMIGFWYLCRFLITGVSEQFGDGVFVGVFMTIILIYLAQRADRAKH